MGKSDDGDGNAGPRFDGMAKIAALGVKIARGCSYHGVALNVDMDLTPFSWINPCGYAGLTTIDLRKIGVQTTWAEAAGRIGARLADQFAGQFTDQFTR